MLASAALSTSLLLVTGLSLGLIYLGVATALICYQFYPSLDISYFFIVYTSVLTFPCAAWLAAYLAEQCIQTKKLNTQIFTSFALIGGSWFFIENNLYVSYLERSLSLLAEQSITNSTLWLLGWSNSLILATSALAITIITMVIAVEVPLSWLSRSSKIFAQYNFTNLRYILLALFAALSMQQIINRLLTI